jgi:hypothetical protein
MVDFIAVAIANKTFHRFASSGVFAEDVTWRLRITSNNTFRGTVS